MSKPDINKEVYSLIALLDYQDGSIVSRTIVKKPAGNVTLFAFDSGQGLSEHKTSFDALVVILEGVLNITVGGETLKPEAGEAVNLPANIPHSILSHSRSKMLLIMLQG